MECWPKEETLTTKYAAQSPCACRRELSITSHTHYRLALDIVGEGLTRFTSSRELVQAVHDALVGESPPGVYPLPLGH